MISGADFQRWGVLMPGDRAGLVIQAATELQRDYGLSRKVALDVALLIAGYHTALAS